MVTPSDVTWDDHRSDLDLCGELSLVCRRDTPRGPDDSGQHRAVRHAVKILLWPQNEWPGTAFRRDVRKFCNRTCPSQLAPSVTSNSPGVPNIVSQIFRDFPRFLHIRQDTGLVGHDCFPSHSWSLITHCSFDYRLPPRRGWELRSSGLLRSEEW
jgi:hypothetical protein